MNLAAKLAILKEGTPDQVQAVWATLQGTQQTLPSQSAIVGSPNQVLFVERSVSTQHLMQPVSLQVEADMKTPLDHMPAPTEQLWFRGTLSSMKSDGTIVVTDAEVVPAPHPLTLTPQQIARYNSRVPQPAPPTSIDFTWNNDYKSGDCHVHPGARVEISVGNNGIDLHFTAQMSTDKSLMGDIFHITFDFYDKADNLILSSPQIDFPQNGAMHPQFGNYNIDYKTTIGPVAQPQTTLQSIASADFGGPC